MTHIIIVNDTEFSAFDWTEAGLDVPPDSEQRHVRNQDLLNEGVHSLGPGEVYFQCDQTIAFDTTFSLKGDGRKFVVIASDNGRHIAKPF